MTRIHSLLLIALAGMFALVAGGAGCSMLSNTESDSGQEPGNLVAEVQRIDVPAQIAPSDTLAVQFYGTVGPNGCYSFARFDVERTTSRLTITPKVQYRGGDDVMCTMAVVPLEETYRAAPPFSEGTLTLVVPQTDGAAVTETVEVVRGEE